MIQLKLPEDRAQGKKLPCGHPRKKRYKAFCLSCYVKSQKGKAKQKRYNQSVKGRINNKRYNNSKKGRRRNSRLYYKQRLMGAGSGVAKRLIIPGNDKETQQRHAKNLIVNKASARRFRARWGHLNVNPQHRHRWEMIREGWWKEDEHPL